MRYHQQMEKIAYKRSNIFFIISILVSQMRWVEPPFINVPHFRWFFFCSRAKKNACSKIDFLTAHRILYKNLKTVSDLRNCISTRPTLQGRLKLKPKAGGRGAGGRGNLFIGGWVLTSSVLSAESCSLRFINVRSKRSI